MVLMNQVATIYSTLHRFHGKIAKTNQEKKHFFHSLSFGLKTPIRFCYHTFAEIGLKHRVKPNISQKQIAGKLHIRWKLSKYINISKNSNNFNSSKSRDKKCRNIWAVFLISFFVLFFWKKCSKLKLWFYSYIKIEFKLNTLMRSPPHTHLK